MTRLHPADLRALVAAILWAHNPHGNGRDSVDDADNLMSWSAELERTQPAEHGACTHELNEWAPDGNNFVCSVCGFWSYDDGETWEPKRTQPEPAEPSGNPGELRAEIREELDADSRCITVYPCPNCGNPDRDENAAYLYEIRDRADKEGWGGFTPLKDWLFSWKERAEAAEGELVAYGRKLDATLDRAEKAEARVAELEGAASADERRLIAAAERAGITYVGCDTPDALADRVAELEAELKGEQDGHEAWEQQAIQDEAEIRRDRLRYRAALEHFTQWILNNLTDRDEDTKEARNMARQARGALRGGEGA